MAAREPEILLGHPGGPFFARSDEGYWSIPKGEPDHADEGLLAVARREFAEEIGRPAPSCQPDGSAPIPLGTIVQKGGKVVYAWAIEGDLDPATARSNVFELEWPPRSGRHGADEPLSLDQRRAMLARREQEWLRGGDAVLAVTAEGQVVGSCGLHRRRGPGTLEIGYWIHSSFLRRRLATRASALLTDAAFTVVGINYVEIHHDEANVASAGVPQRLGFEFVGEQPDERAAPSDSGIDCTWRMSRTIWLAQRHHR